MTEGFN